MRNIFINLFAVVAFAIVAGGILSPLPLYAAEMSFSCKESGFVDSDWLCTPPAEKPPLPNNCKVISGSWVCTGVPSGYSCEETPGFLIRPASLQCSRSGNITTVPQTPSTPSAPSTQTTRTTCPPGTPAGELCYTPLEPLPGNIDESGKPGSFGSLLNGVFRILISLGGLVAVLALVIGGITYMVSDIADKKEQARKRISGALWGLLILISSVLILQTINPQLLNFNFGPSGNAGGAATTNTSATQTNSTSNTTVESSGVITIKSNDQSGSALLQSFTSKCAGSVSKKGSSVEENFTRDTYECVK